MNFLLEKDLEKAKAEEVIALENLKKAESVRNSGHCPETVALYNIAFCKHYLAEMRVSCVQKTLQKYDAEIVMNKSRVDFEALKIGLEPVLETNFEAKLLLSEASSKYQIAKANLTIAELYEEIAELNVARLDDRLK